MLSEKETTSASTNARALILWKSRHEFSGWVILLGLVISVIGFLALWYYHDPGFMLIFTRPVHGIVRFMASVMRFLVAPGLALLLTGIIFCTVSSRRYNSCKHLIKRSGEQEVVDSLIHQAEIGKPGEYESIIAILGDIGNKKAIECVISALNNHREEIRIVAAKALGKIGGELALAPLIKALKDTNADVRKTAAWALGQIGDVSALEPLEETSRDKDIEVQQFVMRALDKIRKRVKL